MSRSIEISFDKDCKHDVSNAKTATAKKNDRDLVVWSLVSECREAGRDHPAEAHQSLLLGRVGDPRTFKIGSRSASMGAAMGKTRAFAVCTVDWLKVGVHKFKIDIPHLKPPEPLDPLDHEAGPGGGPVSETGTGGSSAMNSDFHGRMPSRWGALALLALVVFLGFEICHISGPPEMEIVAASIDKLYESDRKDQAGDGEGPGCPRLAH